MAADVDHAVDRRRAAEAAAARPPQLAVVQVAAPARSRSPSCSRPSGLIRPPTPAGIRTSSELSLPPGLQQQHPGLAVGRQPVGQHAAGRAGADDDVVVTVVGHASSSQFHLPTRVGQAACPAPAAGEPAARSSSKLRHSPAVLAAGPRQSKRRHPATTAKQRPSARSREAGCQDSDSDWPPRRPPQRPRPPLAHLKR